MTLHSLPIGRWPICILLLACLICMPSAVLAADVDVYAEGAYTETDLAIYIYADISPDILSYGVKLTYGTSELTLTSAEKNDAVWFFGDGTPTGNYNYMEPETATSGEVIIIGGKLDTADPTAGVTGGRVLLGKVFFDRVGSTMPFIPTLSIDYARGGDFDNFVQTNGVVLDDEVDGVSFAVEIHERGDANGDGVITAFDVLSLRQNLSNPSPPVFMDCNADGIVSSFDILCVRTKL